MINLQFQESARAQEMGYNDPIHKSIEDTHANYNALVCGNVHVSQFEKQ